MGYSYKKFAISAIMWRYITETIQETNQKLCRSNFDSVTGLFIGRYEMLIRLALLLHCISFRQGVPAKRHAYGLFVY